MPALNDAQLAEHVAILNKVKLDKGLDYETIGKMVVASILRENEENMRTQKPDSKGHVLLKSNLRHSARVHMDPTIVVCCICEDGPIIICRGACCDFP
ncbi:hypothetical protein [Methyloceanibacter sp.]|uniref:hypothetical protein n=1 Tax=Methyloceanibacter sp. TaxID=1965321 RepID=UPI003D6D0C2A